MASIDSILGSTNTGMSVASGAAGFLDSIFGWSAKRQNKYQNQLMDKQFNQQKEFYQMQLEDQLEQWNRENEYNDPTNAYKRLVNGLERNGLNKALAIAALVSLGYSQSEAALAIAKIDATLPVEEIIKLALRSMAGRR